MVDDLGGLGSRAWSPPLPIVWRGADGAVVEKRRLQAVRKTGQRLLGIRFTGKGRAAQRLEGFDFVVTLLAPLLIDGTLGLRLAMFRVDEQPALRDAAIARGHDVIAIALWSGAIVWGSAWARTAWASRKVAGTRVIHLTGLGELLEIVGTIEGTVGHQIRRAIGGL